ncbi:Do family serine endopeptidase [Aquamicrobium terrae]|uniref:Probable periplasmic serine endoprotease DegP-like n=1 Tax=Aquamicrobium terrae TaxID=1324945 RepID=A0ABV2MVC6_9HYPH
MTSVSHIVSRRSKRLAAAAASLAIAGAVGFTAVTAGTEPVLAEAVRVEAPQVPSFADVVSNVTPAVVSVRVKAKVDQTADRGPTFGFPEEGFGNLPPDHPMRRFFREFRGHGDRDGRPRAERRGPAKPRPVAQGSGFFISEDGYLVTNNHVVNDGSAFTVVTNDGKELDAKLIGTDERTDLAVLKVDSDTKFTYVDFADDSQVRVGDWVVAVGNPFGLGGTVTAGIISARGRDIGAGPYDDFIQIDAAVNRGNSGGPAFNLGGQVVGINTAIFSPSGGNVGIAFAIPASTAKQVVDDLMKNGSVARGWLGVEIQPVTKDIAESLGLNSDKGAIVANAQDDGPARKAGIVSGDVITQVDGKDVASSRDLARVIAGYAPGSTVDINLWRNGKAESIKVELGKLPGADKAASTDSDGSSASPADTLADLGLTVTASDDGKGLVVTDVDPDSDAADRGIQAGDVITAVNSDEVNNVKDVTDAMDKAAKAGRKSVLVQISRDSANRFVALPISQG